MSKNGVLNDKGNERYCDIHGQHAILHTCNNYPNNIKKEIKDLTNKFIRDCLNGNVNINDEYMYYQGE
jgi:hypothetical protein